MPDLWDEPDLTFSKIVLCWLLKKDSRICTTEFSKSLINSMEYDIDKEELSGLLSTNRIIPDAYLIQEEIKTVFLFEVEDTHPIPPDKLRKLSEIWFRLDSLDWEMRVFTIDRYMHHWSVLPLSKIWFTLEFSGKYRRTPKEIVASKENNTDWEALYRSIRDKHVFEDEGWV